MADSKVLFLNNYTSTGIGDFGVDLQDSLTRLGLALVLEVTDPQGRGSIRQCWRLLSSNSPVIANIGLTAWGRSPLRNLAGFLTLGVRGALRKNTIVLLHNVIEVISVEDSGYHVSSLIRLGSHAAVKLLLPTILVTFSPGVAGALKQSYGIEDCILTPIPCRGGAKPKKTFNGPKPAAVFVGYLAPYKGLDFLAESWKSLKDVVSLKVVGGPHRVLSSQKGFQAWLSKTKENLQGVDAELLGRIPNNDLDEYLTQCDLAVLPYSSTSGGTAAFSRLAAAGLPVIATDLPEFKWLKSLGAGIVICESRSEAFSGAIRGLLRNPDLLDSLRKSQLAFASKFSDVRFASFLMQLVRSKRSGDDSNLGPIRLAWRDESVALSRE